MDRPCLKCPQCNEKTEIEATFFVKKYLKTGAYLAKGFKYLCLSCNKTWEEAWEK